jgi:hypothetical protein
MSKIDSLVDHLLSSVRVYVGGKGYPEDLIYMNSERYCKILEVEKEVIAAYAVRHILDLSPPGHDVRSDLVRPVRLPEDVIRFYGRIHSGLLIWRKEYQLDVPGACDIGHLAEWRHIPADTSYHLLRFCEITSEDSYYALRSKDDGLNWDVVIALDEGPDVETVEEGYSHHPSFTHWLEWMIQNDGWPVFEGMVEKGSGYIEPYCERMPDAEAALWSSSVSVAADST